MYLTTQFNVDIGRVERNKALALVQKKSLFSLAQSIAKEHARKSDGTCTADDVQKELINLGHTPGDLGNAAGALFRGGDWEFTGLWKVSERVSNHARVIRVWKLKDFGV